MNNRVYYGQYSLTHWVKLILKKNIVLPSYQRHFVWKEKDVKSLIETFKIGQFVPPITIGAFKGADGKNKNLIIDGQQRLTSILLAYLGLFPDPITFKTSFTALADGNDGIVDEDDIPINTENIDSVIKWTFRRLIKRGKNRKEILENIVEGNYKSVDFGVRENFLNKTFLGFSYLVPHSDNWHDQQKYYSSVFRKINAKGVVLVPQESRASLYYLDNDLVGFFDPEIFKTLKVRQFNHEPQVDFVRFVSILSQYVKDGNIGKVVSGFKSKIEEYFEKYINDVVGEEESGLFQNFDDIFPNREYKIRFAKMENTIKELQIPKLFNSIIDADIYLFGLIYEIAFKDRAIDVTKKADLFNDIEAAIAVFKGDSAHKRSPGALKYLKERINSSLEIYSRYYV